MTCAAIRLLLSVSLAALLGAVLAGGAHAAPPSFSGIGDAPGGPFESRAFAVSNGGVVVGTAVVESENPHTDSGDSRAALWTQAGGLELLPEAAVGAIDISADGSVVLAVGPGNSGDFLYTEAEGLLPFGEGLKVRALSADGSTVVGRLERPDLSTVEAFRWTAAGGVESLGFLPHTNPRSQAYAVSDDGSVAAGDASNDELAPGFLWSADAGMEPMESLDPGPQRARVLSGNGFRVAGMSNGQPYRWSPTHGYWWLGNSFTPDIPKIPQDMEHFGGRLVGGNPSAAVSAAFLWNETDGMREFQVLLVEDYGLDLAGWTLLSANGISPNGQWVVGEGLNPNGDREGWVASLGSPKCGLGFEVALVLGALAPLHRRRHRGGAGRAA